MTEESKEKVGTTAPTSYAEQIAADVIAQMAADGHPAWPVAFSAEYSRMYISDLETMAPAGGATDQMALVFAPAAENYERVGWGGVRITITIGILFDVMVTTANGEVTDPQIGAYEALVDQITTWLMGPRKFAQGFWASDPVTVKGDHYNEHLYEKTEFHVPVLIDFIYDGTVT